MIDLRIERCAHAIVDTQTDFWSGLRQITPVTVAGRGLGLDGRGE